MKRWVKRLALWGGGGILALVLLLAAGAWFVLGTQPGSRFLFKRLGALMPGSFEVQALQGRISGPLTIQGLTYKRPSIEVHVDRLALDWRLGELWRRRLDIDRLWADGVHITTTPTPQQQPSPLPDVHLHTNIMVRDARVTNLTMRSSSDPAGTPPAVYDEIDLKTTEIHDNFKIDRLVVRSPLMRAEVTGSVQPQGSYPVDLLVRWTARPAGMAPLAGHGSATGSLDRMRIAHDLTAPFPARLDAVLLQPMTDLRLAGRLNFSGVNPRRLQANLPDIPASGQVSIQGRIDSFTSWGTVDGTVAPAGRLSLSYRVVRRGENWQVEQADVSLPGTPSRLAARGRLVLHDQGLDFDGETSWHDLAWPPRGAASLRSASGQAHITAHQRGDNLASQGDLRAAVSTLGTLSAAYRLARQGERWRLEQADITVPGRPTRLSAQGSVTLHGQDVLLDAGVSWRDLAWPLNGAPEVRSREGRARVAGSLDNYQAQLDAEIAGGNPTPVPRLAAAPVAAPTAAPTLASLPPSRVSIAGTGGKNSFRISRLDANLLSGHLSGQGNVAWSPRLRWDLGLSGQGLDPAALAPDFPGSLAFAATTRGEMLPAGMSGTVDLPSLRGTLRRQPLAVSAALRLSGPRYDLSQLDVRWSTARLKASGTLGDRFDLGFDLSAPNIGLALPADAGSLTARGHISGTAKTPHIQANVQTEGLRAAGAGAAKATVAADVDLAPEGVFQVDVTGTGITAAGQNVSDLALHGRGRASAHTVTLTASGVGERPDTKLDVALSGGIAGVAGAAGGIGPAAAWHGQLARLDLRSQPAGNWSLEGAAPLDASARSLRLGQLCWRSGGGRLCTNASWASNGPWGLDATLAALPLSLLSAVLPSDLTVTGTVNGTARARGGPAGLASADVDLAPGPGELRFPADGGRTQVVRFERGSIKAQTGAGGGDAVAALSFTGIGSLGAQLRLPRLAPGIVLKNQPLAGTITAHFADLAFVQGFAPDLRHVGGAFDADLRLAGTVGAPHLLGTARLHNGRAQVPLYGLDVRDLQLAATGDGSGSLTIDGAVRSGPGTVAVQGRASLAPSVATPVHLTIQGKNFQVMNTEEVRLRVSPTLDFTYQGTVARLTGDVEVPYARTDIEKHKAGPVEPSKDVVFVSASPTVEKPRASSVAVSARVRVILDKEGIDLSALGLKGKPSGSLLAIEEPGRPAMGVGEIDISEGTFKAYGQDLTIERGRLIFGGGPIDNPGIDLRAYRTSDDGTVKAGIEAKGTLKVPEVTVWSQPPMGEADALAYVMLGHPLGQANAKEGSLVANAATSLGLKGGNMLAKKIGSRFGLEEARLESKGGLSQTSLVLGKYLSPHLYVVYGIGLFEPVNTFRVRYIMNKQWTLQAESGGNTTGADVLYTLER